MKSEDFNEEELAQVMSPKPQSLEVVDPLNEPHWREGLVISHRVETFSKPVQFDAEENQNLAKKCVGTFLAGDDLNYHNSDRIQMLEATLDRYKLKEHFDIDSVMNYGDAYYKWIEVH